MAAIDHVKCWVVLLALFFNRLCNRIKSYLGVLYVDHGTYGYYEYKEVPMSSVIQPINRLRACEVYDAFRPEDVMISTYPKTGSHFAGHIVLSIYKEAGVLKEKRNGFPPFEPFELAPQALRKRFTDKPLHDLDAAESPRVILSHLPMKIMPPKVRDGQVKVITCIRNPKDVACSMLPFKQKVGCISPKLTFHEFVKIYVAGKGPYGDYMDYLRQWYPHRHSPNMLTLVYEEMIKDLETTVYRVSEFLGIKLTFEQVLRVTAANTFKNKKNEVHPSNRLVLRKGASGGWKSEFTVEQSLLCDEWIQKGLQGMEDLKFQYD